MNDQKKIDPYEPELICHVGTLLAKNTARKGVHRQ